MPMFTRSTRTVEEERELFEPIYIDKLKERRQKIEKLYERIKLKQNEHLVN